VPRERKHLKLLSGGTERVWFDLRPRKLSCVWLTARFDTDNVRGPGELSWCVSYGSDISQKAFRLVLHQCAAAAAAATASHPASFPEASASKNDAASSPFSLLFSSLLTFVSSFFPSVFPDRVWPRRLPFLFSLPQGSLLTYKSS